MSAKSRLSRPPSTGRNDRVRSSWLVEEGIAPTRPTECASPMYQNRPPRIIVPTPTSKAVGGARRAGGAGAAHRYDHCLLRWDHRAILHAPRRDRLHGGRADRGQEDLPGVLAMGLRHAPEAHAASGRPRSLPAPRCNRGGTVSSSTTSASIRGTAQKAGTVPDRRSRPWCPTIRRRR